MVDSIVSGYGSLNDSQLTLEIGRECEPMSLCQQHKVSGLCAKLWNISTTFGLPLASLPRMPSEETTVLAPLTTTLPVYLEKLLACSDCLEFPLALHSLFSNLSQTQFQQYVHYFVTWKEK